MNLILEKDVKNLGKAGDKVSVKPGYARNWLLPKKLAVTLNEDRLKEWKHKQHIIEIRKKKAGDDRDSTISKLNEIHLVFEKEAKNEGQLFGSVSSVEISRILFEKHNLSVDKRDILSDPLKTVGKHKVKISLDTKRETFLSVSIEKSSSRKENKENKDKKDIYKETEKKTDSDRESGETQTSIQNKQNSEE